MTVPSAAAPFQPEQYLGLPLPAVLADLSGRESTQSFVEEQGRVEPHSPVQQATEPVTCRPASLLPTTVAGASPAGAPDDLDIPDVILETYLGGGGQGWVYAGRVRSSGQLVAVKVLRADYVAAQ